MTDDPTAHIDAGPPDAELLEQVANACTVSFEAFYQRHVAACTATARQHLPTDASVDEVVQDVFLRVWKHAARYDAARASARTWLLRITHNAAVDASRRQQRHRARHRPLDVVAEPASVEPEPDLLAVHREAAHELWAAVDQLPHRQRVPLHLAYSGGLTQREVAAHLGIPLGTVKTRTRDGLQNLRMRLPEPRHED